MVVGEVATGTDVLVIGGGPGGYAAALASAAPGRSVTLVERDRLGGVCLNYGCIPSKALLHVAQAAALRDEAAEWGLDITASVDMGRVQRWMAVTVERLTGGVGQLLKGAGVKVVKGNARFAAARRVAVSDGPDAGFFEFGKVIVATGSRAREMPELPFDGGRVLDSTAALGLDHVPERLVVVGADYIGVELATAFAKLGSQVSVVEPGDRLLPEVPAGLARVVEKALVARGVGVVTEATVTGLDHEQLLVKGPSGESKLAAAVVLVSAGRRPNTDELGLEHTGVRLDATGLIAVDPSRRAGKDVYAVGDVTAGPPLAHKALAEAEVAATAAAGRPAAFDPAAIPIVVFSDPEVATVGATREQAAEAGAEARSFTFPLAASGRAATLGRSVGQVEVVADGDGTVLGVHMAGPGAVELAAHAALAVETAATLEDLALTIAPHPTLSEGLAEAALGAAGRPRHARRSRR
jgi:dihydrolipoamide dehydrogenase